MARQLDMARQAMGEKGWREHVRRSLAAVFKARVVEPAGVKVVSGTVHSSESAVSQAADGNREIPMSWTPGIDRLDPDRAFAQEHARLVYDAQLVPIDELTQDQKLRILESLVRQKLGPTGDAIVADFRRLVGT